MFCIFFLNIYYFLELPIEHKKPPSYSNDLCLTLLYDNHCIFAGNREHNSHSSSKSSESRRKPDQKPTRVRTVLNEKQLHTLRTCYNANPRPDALMKEQLVEMTNLSPRVIRVWFQNKRCKDKKRSILMKQMQQQQQDKVSLTKES